MKLEQLLLHLRLSVVIDQLAQSIDRTMWSLYAEQFNILFISIESARD